MKGTHVADLVIIFHVDATATLNLRNVQSIRRALTRLLRWLSRFPLSPVESVWVPWGAGYHDLMICVSVVAHFGNDFSSVTTPLRIRIPWRTTLTCRRIPPFVCPPLFIMPHLVPALGDCYEVYTLLQKKEPGSDLCHPLHRL